MFCIAEFGKKLISNTTFLLIDWLAVAIFSFLFWLVIGKLLTKEDYGIIATVINTAVIVSGISFFGFGTAITKLIPEYVQQKKEKLSYVLTKFSFKLIIIVNLVIAAALIIFSNQIAPSLKLSPIHIILIGILTFATSMSNFSSSILQGFQKMKKVSFTDALGYIIKAAGSFVFLMLFLNNLIPIIVFTFALFIIFFLRFDKKWFTAVGNQLNYSEILKHYAFPTFISSIAWMIFNNAQYLILTVIQDPSTTGVFSVAAIVTTLIAVIPSTMSNAFFPLLSQLSVSSTFKKQQKFYISMTLRYALFISIPLAMIFILFPTKIIILFSKSEFLGAKSLFPILSIAALLNGIGMLFSASLYALKKIKLQRNIIVVTAIIFLSLSIMLTKTFSAIGLAISYTTTMIFFFSASLYYLRKLVKFDTHIFTIMKIVVASSVWIAFFVFISGFTSNAILQVLLLALSSVIYLLMLLPLRFYKNEDIRVLEFIKNYIPKTVKPILENIMSIIVKFT